MTTLELPPTVAPWLDAIVDATCELAEGTLGWFASPVDGAVPHLPASGEGAYVPMFTDGYAVQLGLVCSAEGAQQVAKQLLCMDQADEDLPPEDVADAVGEVVNILAGSVKSRLIEVEPSIKLGLPVYLSGHLQPSHSTEVGARQVAIGPVRATLLVIRNASR